MPAVSPRIGEFLIKTTKTNDIDSALKKVFSDYIELKLRSLHGTIDQFEKKWGMSFAVFKKRMKSGSLSQKMYTYDAENDFWQWEEAETLRKHYEVLRKDWT